MDYYFLLIIILSLSFVQSVLGIGLLVLGTPTLMFLGNSFFETMSIIIPSSIVISFLQIIDEKNDINKFKSEFLIYCLPAVFLGLLFIKLYGELINFKLLLGIMLLLSGLVRAKKNYKKTSEIISNNKKKFQIFIGLVHGISNMGGGFLALFSSSLFKEKKIIRSSIAYGYLLMGLLQYLFLLIFVENVFRKDIFLFILISIFSYYILGKPLFSKISNDLFQKLITSIIIIYGISVITAQI